jgi:hypothetical protein
MTRMTMTRMTMTRVTMTRVTMTLVAGLRGDLRTSTLSGLIDVRDGQLATT